jgi:spore coat polysaccharide biosynthesis protein SpsF (cytidylyltransferase family)
MRTIAVIQARMGSTRQPGKVLADIEGRPLILWTIGAVSDVAGLDDLVIATTDQATDDPFAEMLQAHGVRVHRGPAHDVLRRVADAVEPLRPDVVLRQTGDNPFADPDVMGAQLAHLAAAGLDYVGIAGLPIGIGAEAVRAEALRIANREAVELAEREHVLPFVNTRPDRFRFEPLPNPPAAVHRRFTVDTEDDLAFARALAARLGERSRPPRIADLEAIVAAEPALREINMHVEQRSPRTSELGTFRVPTGPKEG